MRTALGSPGRRPSPCRGPSRIVTARSSSSPARFDERHGGLRRAPKFPSNLPVRLLLRHHRRTGDANAAAHGDAHPGEDGGRRAPRPAGRRLPPLLDRRAMARAALREDALRQRAPGRRLRRGLAGDGAARPRPGGAHHGRLPPARDDLARGRVHLGDRRRLRGRGGPLLRLDGGGARAGAGGGRAGRFMAFYGVSAGGNFEGRNILYGAEPRRGPLGGARARPGAPAAGAGGSRAAAARREDPGGLERPRHLGAGRRRARAGRAALRGGGGARRRVRAHAHGEGGPPAAELARGRGGRARPTSTTTPSWPRACSTCSRPPSTRAGWQPPSISPTGWRRSSPTPPAGAGS